MRDYINLYFLLYGLPEARICSSLLPLEIFDIRNSNSAFTASKDILYKTLTNLEVMMIHVLTISYLLSVLYYRLPLTFFMPKTLD